MEDDELTELEEYEHFTRGSNVALRTVFHIRCRDVADRNALISALKAVSMTHEELESRGFRGSLQYQLAYRTPVKPA